MRIIAGKFRGRKLESPPEVVRPTRDRVRESLFAMLAEIVAGARVLELYAGSGAIGLEALSRGAESLCWVESSRNVYRQLCRNIEDILGPDWQSRHRAVCADAADFIGRQQAEPYNLIFADPPYDKDGRGSPLPQLLETIEESGALADGGLFIYEMGSKQDWEALRGWELLRNRSWGQTRILIMRRFA